ncbi:MAG: ATP-binding cassette domain-containing protein, partial [Gaiellales bacterium]
MSTAETLLEVEDLVTRYPVPRGFVGAIRREPKLQVHAVEGVTFNVAPGEMLALVGESGCGKTTTAQSVVRMVENDSGSIRFRGQELSGLGPSDMRPLRKDIQMIYQDPYESLDPRFSVRDTIEEPLLIHGVKTSGEDREAKVREAMERAGLTPPDLYIERYPHELSGGQRQRVVIAGALVLEPQVLIADEPVASLDASVRGEILSLRLRLRDDLGLAALVVTHDLGLAWNIADRLAVMYLGRIVEVGTPEQVFASPRHPYTRALMS